MFWTNVLNRARFSSRLPLNKMLHSEASSIDPNEVIKFSKMADKWWNLDGPACMLHSMNDCRAKFVRSRLCNFLNLDRNSMRPLQGLSILEVGCGGGLLTESLARLGARVTGLDVSAQCIDVCRYHAYNVSGFSKEEIQYETQSLEEFAKNNQSSFDVVCSMEVLEHVCVVDEFVQNLTSLSRPGGHVFVSTINRTVKSYLLTILMAEKLLNWIPDGTHSWTKYIRSYELIALLRRRGFYILDLAGMEYDLINDRWSLTNDVDCNYILQFSIPERE